jgi:hypothetical protein
VPLAALALVVVAAARLDVEVTLDARAVGEDDCPEVMDPPPAPPVVITVPPAVLFAIAVPFGAIVIVVFTAKDACAENRVENAVEFVVTLRQVSLVSRLRIPGAQTSAAMLQNGAPGIVTLSQTIPALLGQHSCPQML